jgi:dTDP-4-amino-4,6-dideoxygalactose transaminase
MHVPFNDLKRRYLAHKSEIDRAIESVLNSGQYILGKHVEEFERSFAQYCGLLYGVGVASGTDAIHLSLRACGVGEGDEVITVANTCVPTIAAINMAGAKAIFVDINPLTFTIDPKKIEAAITKNTSAIVPVHLYGRCADMHAILDVASKYNLIVIEDCAQAHGASYYGLKAGSMGDVGCFSFYPTKNLGAFGDAGMVVTSNREIADNVRMLRQYGEVTRYHSEVKGFNSRLDDMQASILLSLLPSIEEQNYRRRDIASIYQSELDGLELVCPQNDFGFHHVYHLFVIRVTGRDNFQIALKENGVTTLIHYPVPIPLQQAYKEYLLQISNIPETMRICKEIVSLPLFPEMTEAEITHVIDICKKLIKRK